MSAPSKHVPNPDPASVASVPALEPGDRLTAAEFERRYDAMPDLKKAELIEGVVYMPSPVRYQLHSAPHSDIVTWLGVYAASTPGVAKADNATVRLDQDNEPQPDALLRIETQCGGQTRISDDDYVEGPPELIAEVASSSVSFDLHTKRHVYRRSGVREYVVWRVLDREIDWFILREGNYDRLSPADDGLLRSEMFPGLWLDAAALLRGDLQTVLAALNRGLQTPEHAAFVRRLAQAGKP
ncbi:MAG: Uma2 family endonuclease [Planctomycetes bacterium]|nr:Uma2 family endonuclease [Planctomycetota bacterium]